MSIPVALIVQARAGGSRFPGKVLHLILGQPMLLWQLDRLSYIPSAPPIIVATPPSEENRPIWDLCERHGYQWLAPPCDEQDVLARYAMVAETCDAEHIIRVTADCPMIDPMVVEALWQTYLQESPPTYLGLADQWADGQDCEAFPRSALLEAARDAQRPSEREHVTPYIKSGQYQPRFLACQFDHYGYQYSVDTQEDMEMVTGILWRAIPQWGYTGWGYREVAFLIETDEAIGDLHMRRPPRNHKYHAQVAAEQAGAYRGPRIGLGA